MDASCLELIPAKSAPPRHLLDIARDYYREHAVPTSRNPKRVIYTARQLVTHFWDDPYPATWKRAQSHGYAQTRIAAGKAAATARRELALLGSMIRHDVKWERTAKCPPIEIPAGSPPRIRFLTREEYRRVMLAPKPARLHRFFLLAFGTGARSEAIEQLTWDRVDFVRRTIDFRLPGVNHKNKRRVVVPISAALYPRLVTMYENRKDDYVIGLGLRGKCSSTYHAAVRVLLDLGMKEKGMCRHVARHTFASWLLQGDPERGIAPATIHQVALLLGDTVSMVEKVYGHVMPGHLQGVVDRMAA